MVVRLACSEEDESYARGSTILDRSCQMSQTKSVWLNNMLSCNLPKCQSILDQLSSGSTRLMLGVAVSKHLVINELRDSGPLTEQLSVAHLGKA